MPTRPLRMIQPGRHLIAHVGGQVVQHHMHGEVSGDVDIDQLEERHHIGAGPTVGGMVASSASQSATPRAEGIGAASISSSIVRAAWRSRSAR